ncbi:MAG TPA: hypothetical protein VF623_00170 [Segetibacter sp.]
MKKRNLLTLFLLCFLACKNKVQDDKPEKFDRQKWATMNDMNYPYRAGMLKNLIDSVKLKGLKKEEVINLLGEPNRTDSGYLFYNVSREYFGNTSFVINSKTLVIKIGKDSTVEWRKIHG